jgi:hypothetical protein
MIGHIRLRFGAPTRNKKDRKDRLTLHRVKFETTDEGSTGATIEGLDIPSSAAPMFYISLLVGAPGIMQNLPLGDDARAYRRHAGLESSRRAGVWYNTQSASLGPA